VSKIILFKVHGAAESHLHAQVQTRAKRADCGRSSSVLARFRASSSLL
jgi:hypothetical protein